MAVADAANKVAAKAACGAASETAESAAGKAYTKVHAEAANSVGGQAGDWVASGTDSKAHNTEGLLDDIAGRVSLPFTSTCSMCGWQLPPVAYVQGMQVRRQKDQYKAQRVYIVGTDLHTNC